MTLFAVSVTGESKNEVIVMEWAKLIVTMLTSIAGVVTAVWAVKRWNHQRSVERDQREAELQKENKKVAALYVNPFLLACENLQSRIYNILEMDGLAALKKRHPGGEYAEETIYYIAQYFGWDGIVSRYGPYTHDPEFMRLTEAIRDTFAKDRLPIGAFCFFRSDQMALGQTIMNRSAGEFGTEFETIPLHEFKRQLAGQPYAKMNSVKESIATLQNAANLDQLEGRQRLAEVQNHLVDLLSHIEQQEGFTVFLSGQRGKVRV